MKKLLIILVGALALGPVGWAENGDPGYDGSALTAGVANQVTTRQNQDVAVNAGDVQSTANVNMTSNYQTRTPPITTFPPYLPYWTHGGWGTVKAYFPNGPTANDQIYETTFDPQDPSDMHELRSVLRTLPHTGVLEAAGGVLNSVAVVLFGAPDSYFRGRGLEIADSIVRDRRPEGKALLVFIDSNVDVSLLKEEGYAYMGKVGVEGDPDRNWDEAYKVAVSEALLWDVDILLISGGMKGVTTGTNITFPSAAAGYSQVNYSLSLLGSKATGITEGKGKAVFSAEAYRYCPERVERRRIPAAIYDRIRARPAPPVPLDSVGPQSAAPRLGGSPAAPVAANQQADDWGYADIPETPVDWDNASADAVLPRRTWTRIPDLTPAPGLAPTPVGVPGPAGGPTPAGVVTPTVAPAPVPPGAVWAPSSVPPSGVVGTVAPAVTASPVDESRPSLSAASAPTRTVAKASASSGRAIPKSSGRDRPGMSISRELFDLAGFPSDQEVDYVQIQ